MCVCIQPLQVYLWLVDAGPETKTNFLKMAKRAGVVSSRIIFGDRADFDAHIQVKPLISNLRKHFCVLLMLVCSAHSLPTSSSTLSRAAVIMACALAAYPVPTGTMLIPQQRMYCGAMCQW
jgi:hypothetical protein